MDSGKLGSQIGYVLHLMSCRRHCRLSWLTDVSLYYRHTEFTIHCLSQCCPRKRFKEPLLPEKLLSPWPAPWVEQRARAVRIMQGGAGADPETNTVSAGRAIDYRVLSSSLHCWLPSTPLSHLEVRSSSTQKQLQAQTLLYSSDLL